jgi:hypothetical protein
MHIRDLFLIAHQASKLDPPPGCQGEAKLGLLTKAEASKLIDELKRRLDR